jgi:excisionase family DNA binding protein
MTTDFDTMPKYLTVKQLAQMLGISLANAYRKMEMRDIPFYRIGRVVRFKLEDVEEYLEKNRIESV